MTSINSYNIVENTSNLIETDSILFNTSINTGLIQFVVRLFQLKGMERNGSAKTRAEVSGGGRKPWKQKGTGQARQGTINAPQWVGGGKAMGPINIKRNVKINRKIHRKSIMMALTSQVENITILTNDSMFESKVNKVKDFLKIFNVQDMSKTNTVYVTTYPSQREAIIGNIQNVNIFSPHSLSVFSILKAKKIFIEETALKQFEETYNV